jgi:hypothetical protein
MWCVAPLFVLVLVERADHDLRPLVYTSAGEDLMHGRSPTSFHGLERTRRLIRTGGPSLTIAWSFLKDALPWTGFSMEAVIISAARLTSSELVVAVIFRAIILSSLTSVCAVLARPSFWRPFRYYARLP